MILSKLGLNGWCWCWCWCWKRCYNTAESPPTPNLPIVVAAEEPLPLEEIVPSDPRNEIVVKNRPDVRYWTRLFLLLLCWTETPSRSWTWLYPNQTIQEVMWTINKPIHSGSRFFVRKRLRLWWLWSGRKTKELDYRREGRSSKTSKTSDDDISLETFLVDLKKGKDSSSALIAELLGNEGPDEEILDEFEDNLPRKFESLGSDSTFASSSTGYDKESHTRSISPYFFDSASADSAYNGVEYVTPNTDDNTDDEDYCLYKAFLT